MKKRQFFLFSIFLFTVLSLQAKTIRYVKVNGTGNGSTWTNASNSIQDMIDNSASGDEVWVAAGTYYPTTETIARDARSRTFLLKSGVNFYGGFAGIETSISQRALADIDYNGKIDSCELVNKTILSGDIDSIPEAWVKTYKTSGTWKWTITGNESNCYRVITGLGKNIVDGFSVTGGNANNSSIISGGGIYITIYTSNSSSFVNNCTVYNCSASSNGGGICSSTTYSNSYITNCNVYNCSATSNGGGICSTSKYSNSYITNCRVNNCFADTGGGIYSSTYFSYSYITNCIVGNCSSSTAGGIYSFSSTANSSSFVNNCVVSNCSATSNGGGICSTSKYSNSYITNCAVNNCFSRIGGGIYSSSSSSDYSPASYTYVTNCTVYNCSASNNGGGVYSYTNSIAYSYITNCVVSNCSAVSNGGGIYSYSDSYSFVTNCSVSNNKIGNNISNIVGGTVSGNISPDITIANVKPTSFIGIATSDNQNAELLISDWHLKRFSPCINNGTSTSTYVSSSVLTGNDIDGNFRVLYGTIDIGAYEYEVPTINIPSTENFNNLSDLNSSSVFYNSAQLNGSQDIVWNISNQKAVFSWQLNYTSVYSQPFFTYQIDGTKSSKIYLQYDMYFQAYAGSISPLGTEKLNVQYSTDLVTWSSVATYSNANGTVANQTYKHDLSNKLAGKKFFIRFNANGANSNRIEKWEIDNVIIDADGLSAVNTLNSDKYIYIVADGTLKISGLQGKENIALYDLTGKIITTKIARSGNLSIKLPCMGIYVVSINSDGIISCVKIVY